MKKKKKKKRKQQKEKAGETKEIRQKGGKKIKPLK